MKNIYNKRENCRSCNEDLETLMFMGEFPLADKLLNNQDLKNEPKVPLSICLCKKCKLLQIAEDIEPEILFKNDYPYYSSQNPTLSEHFSASANELIKKMNLNDSSWVFEIACNDGVMLDSFAKRGIPASGIDPAIGPALAAKERGFDVINDFFSDKLAIEISKTHSKKADLILGNNVLAHVPDPNVLLKGISILLSDTGCAVIEVPYALDLLLKTEFDTIFHQHYSYFSLLSLQPLFERNGLYINSIKRISIHGGSLRITASKNPGKDESVLALEKLEDEGGIQSNEIYYQFISNIDHLKHQLIQLLEELKSSGKSIAGFGAAGKATTLMNYFGIDKHYVSYIADTNIHKQGKFFPGNAIPIVSPDEIYNHPSDYIIILAWNFANEIMKQMENYKLNGGKFIIPLPKPIIV